MAGPTDFVVDPEKPPLSPADSISSKESEYVVDKAAERRCVRAVT